MSVKWWLGVAALSILRGQPLLASATPFGSWYTAGATDGGFKICTQAKACDNNTMILALGNLTEAAYYDVTSVQHSVRGFDSSPKFIFGNNHTIDHGNGALSVSQGYSAAIPNDGIQMPYLLPSNGDPVLTCNVSQLVSGNLATFNGSFGVPVTTGAIQMDFEIRDWTPTFPDNFVNLSLAIKLVDPNPVYLDWGNIGEMLAGNVRRYYLSYTVYFDLPLVAVEKDGAQVEVSSRVSDGADGNFILQLGFPASSLIKYTFLISGLSGMVTTTTPTTTPPTTTAPTPAPTAAPKPLVAKPPTALKTRPGGFEFCVAANCNIYDGSFSVMLDRLGAGATLTDNSTLVFDTVMTNFSSSAESLLFVTPNASMNNYTDSFSSSSSNVFKSLFMSVPISGGRATRLSESDFAAMNDTDAAYVFLNLEHLVDPGTLAASYNIVDLPKGAVKLSVALFLPAAQFSPISITTPAITFFISAFQRGKMVSNVTVDRQMYTTRVILGDDMYLEFSDDATVDSYSSPMTVAAKLHTSGEFEGLIQLSLLFDSVTSSLRCEAAISSAAVDNGTASTSTWTPPAPPTRVGGRDIKTQILTLSNGEFGLCFNTSNCDTTSVKMSFSGLGSNSSSGLTKLDQFRNAAGFQLRNPELVVEGNVTKWSTGFHAFVPQSQTRPPFPYDASLASTSTFPEFEVQVDQFLTHGFASNGLQKITVPRGGLKFAMNITKWVFASTADSLVLNVTIGNATGTGAPGAPRFQDESADTGTDLSRATFDVSTLVEFPLLAVVDGVMRPIVVTSSYDASVGITFTLTFPYFAHSLYYDPVLSSTVLEDDQAADEAGSRGEDVNLRTHGSKSPKDDHVAIILLAFLAFVVVLSVARCTRRVSVKLDFSKIIP